MSEYDDWKQENDRWEAYLYPNGVLRNKLGITKAAKWHKTECEFVAARNTALRPNTGLTTGNVGEELFAGTTSACAENTDSLVVDVLCAWNYLRVRGEYLVHRLWLVSESELPPRARRIPYLDISHLCDDGTTSACAENTLPLHMQTYTPRNYLRVRGEYEKNPYSQKTGLELPPRARRILHIGGGDELQIGTTSACAENTHVCG